MSRSDQATGQMSTYRFPDELRVDELLLRGPIESDIETIAPAFRDPAVGGEASLPPVDADTLRVMLRDQLPGMRAQGLLAAYVIQDVPQRRAARRRVAAPLRSVARRRRIGYWLFVSARGRGVATRSVRRMTEHAAANGIWRVEAHVRIGNNASERVLERLGFEREGIKRKYLRHGNDRVDATLFSLLADDA